MAIDWSRYEPQAFADQSQAYLAQKRREREIAEAQTRTQQAASLPLPGAAPYVPHLQEQAEAAKPGIQNLFELVGRPEAAFRGALTAPNPLTGFLSGIRGENVPGYSEAWGVPGAVEKVLSFGLDPLNIVPFGRLAGGARSAITGIRGATEAAPAIREITRLPRYPVQEALAAGTRETPLEPVRRLVTKIPVLGPKLMSLVSPRLADRDSSIGAIMNAYDGSVESATQFAETLVARVTGGRALTSQIDDEGRLILTDGRHVAPIDVFEEPGRFQGALPAQDYDIAVRGGQLLTDISRGGVEGAPVLAPYRALVKQVRDLYDPETAARFDIPESVARGQKSFWPRYIIHDEAGTSRSVGTGGLRTGQHGRVFEWEEEGLQQGERYASPLEALQLRLTDHARSMSEMETLVALKPYITGVGAAAREEAASIFHPFIPSSGVKAGDDIKQIAETGFLQRLWASPEDAVKIKERFEREAAFRAGGGTARLVGGLADVNALARTVQSSGDLSAWFLQNLVTLATNPARGMASMWMSLRAAIDPLVVGKFYASPGFQDVMSRAPGLLMGGTGGAGEAFETLGKAGGIGKQFLEKTPVLSGVVKRSQAAFSLSGDFSRYMGARALLPLAEREGRVAELVDFLNHSTGTLSMKQMGISPVQRGVESWIAFAPRYGRGSLALFGDLGSGRLAGTEAVNAFGSMLLFGLGMYSATARALGQTPELDPRRASFLTVQIGDQRIGVGTVFRSLLQTAAKISAQVEGKEPFNLNDPSMENPLVRLARSRLSPVGSTLADAISGETFIGVPLSGINPLAYAGTKLAPFTMAAFVNEHGDLTNAKNWPGAAIGTAAQFTGLRSFPEPRRDLQNTVAAELFPGKTYDQLSLPEQARVQNDPRIKELPQPQGEAYALARETGKVTEQYRAELETLAARVESGGTDAITTRQFRAQLHDLQKTRNVQTEALQARYPEQVPQARTQERQVYNQYLKLLTEPDPTTGRIDYEEADSFLASLSPEQQAYIQDAQAAGTERLGPKAKALVQELYAARDQLEPYWKLFQTNMERAGIWDEWQTASGPGREALQKDRRYLLAQRRLRIDRDRMRLRDPNIDAQLVRWGYVTTPIRQRRK